MPKSAVPTPPNVRPNFCSGGTVYAIRPGDSLSSLAKRFQTTAEDILAANPGIAPTRLYLGQEICIPVPPQQTDCPGGFSHTVVIGDTFYNIARRNGIAVPALAAANPGVAPGRLQIGQILCIPAPAPLPQPCGGTPYRIQPGDTFLGLARRFGYTLDALLAANPGLDPRALPVGREICLPPAPGSGPFPCYGGSIYIVQPGDTLYAIARHFGYPVSRLIDANQQLPDPDQLEAGTLVCLPR